MIVQSYRISVRALLSSCPTVPAETAEFLYPELLHIGQLPAPPVSAVRALPPSAAPPPSSPSLEKSVSLLLFASQFHNYRHYTFSLYFKYQFIKHLASSQNVRCLIFCLKMLVLPCPNIFSIQYLIHSQHIVTHLKCIVTIWNAPYFRNGREMQDPLPLWQGAEDRGGPGSISRREQPVPVLPQRQENADVAAVVARSGGPGCHGKHLSQGSASSGASATAGKCRFHCRCGLGRKSGAIWNGGTSWSFLPKGLRGPHPRNLPYGDERRENIHQEHSNRHDSSDHQYGQRS